MSRHRYFPALPEESEAEDDSEKIVGTETKQVGKGEAATMSKGGDEFAAHEHEKYFGEKDSGERGYLWQRHFEEEEEMVVDMRRGGEAEEGIAHRLTGSEDTLRKTLHSSRREMKEGEYGGLYEEEEEKKEEEEEEEEEDSNETEHDKDGDGNEDEAGEEENNDESDEENMENESKFRKPSRQTEYEQRRRKSSTGSHDSDMDSSHLHSPLFARMPEEVVLELKKDYTVRYRAMTRAALSGYVYTLLTAIGAYVKGSANLDEERRELPLHARDLRRVRIYIQQGNRVLEQIFAFVLVWRAVCVCVCVCLSVCLYFFPLFLSHSLSFFYCTLFSAGLHNL